MGSSRGLSFLRPSLRSGLHPSLRLILRRHLWRSLWNGLRPGNPRTPGRAWLLLAATLVTVLQSGCRAESWPLWDQYASRYVDSQGRVLDRQDGDRQDGDRQDGDKQGADRTTSEGQAYAMFFALAANDRARFDHLLKWTEDNLAQGDLTQRLPSWNWGKSADGQWKVLDANSASDADLWMSYTLLEAGRLWKEPRYANLGRVMAARIAQEEVATLPGFGPVVLPGPSGFHPSAAVWLVNPSYTPLPLLQRLATELPDGPWAALAAHQSQLLRATSANGFAMDWVEYNAMGAPGQQWTPVALPAQAIKKGTAAQQPSGAVAGRRDDGLQEIGGGAENAISAAAQAAAAQPDASGGVGSYDAIRVYLWAGMTDSATPQAKQCLAAIPGMAVYLSKQLLPPASVDARGAVVDAKGPIGFSAAVVPYLQALGMKREAAAQLERVAATRDAATGLYGRQQFYYDQNLALFSLGYEEGRARFDRDGKLKVKWK